MEIVNKRILTMLCVCVVSCFWLCVTARTLANQAPLSMGFPSKNSGVDCHFLLLGFFQIQGWDPHFLYLLHWQTYSLPLNHLKAQHCYRNTESGEKLAELWTDEGLVNSAWCRQCHWLHDRQDTKDTRGSNSATFKNLYHCKKWLHGKKSLELPFYGPQFICYFVNFRDKNIP